MGKSPDEKLVTAILSPNDNDNDFLNSFNGPFRGMVEIQLNNKYIMFKNDIHIEFVFLNTQKIFKNKIIK